MKHSAIVTTAFPRRPFLRRPFLVATLLMGAVLMGSIAFFAGINTAFSQDKKKETKEKDKLPQVLLKTNKGEILLELYEDQAPNTVANFVSLAEKGFYDKTKFHRVIPNFMAQGGDPKGNGSGGPGYRIKCECFRKDHKLHERGVISMAHTEEKDTGGSQFFITFKEQPHLDGVHTVFGHVIKGMDVVDKLKQGDVVEKATVEQKRDHEYKPEVIKE
jgi:peptidyl-prolyl cis-trans isomerase B (cyclophilin B)